MSRRDEINHPQPPTIPRDLFHQQFTNLVGILVGISFFMAGSTYITSKKNHENQHVSREKNKVLGCPRKLVNGLKPTYKVGYIGVIIHLLTIDPIFQRHFQVGAPPISHFLPTGRCLGQPQGTKNKSAWVNVWWNFPSQTRPTEHGNVS